MREKLKSVLIMVLMVTTLCGCANTIDEQEVKKAEPLVIEKDLSETAEFKKEFYKQLENKDVSLTVYVDNAEDFNYKGKLEVVQDGLDGRELMLFIYADQKSMESDWF